MRIILKYHFVFRKLGKMSQNLSSAAVVIGTLRVKIIFLFILPLHNNVSSSALGTFSLFLSSSDFLKINFFKKFFQEPKLFANIISRRQKSPLNRSSYMWASSFLEKQYPIYIFIKNILSLLLLNWRKLPHSSNEVHTLFFPKVQRKFFSPSFSIMCRFSLEHLD